MGISWRHHAKYIDGKLKLKDHDEIAWILPEKLPDYDISSADIPTANKIAQNYKEKNSFYR